jgi:hypothetical protein
MTCEITKMEGSKGCSKEGKIKWFIRMLMPAGVEDCSIGVT